MNIAIIGGGWLGCHLANNFKNSHNVKIYEQDSIFSGVSSFNQNRLHLGYHYARSFETRKLCIETFDQFLNQYGFLTTNIDNNLYAVPQKESYIDFQTYLKIYDNYDHNIINENELSNVEGTISVKEKYIDNEKAKEFFNKTLKDILIYKKITKEDIVELSKNNELVIDCSNNKFYFNKTIKRNIGDIFFYKNIQKSNFSSLTLVDGNLFSIFPFKDDIFSITDVSITTDNSLTLDQKIDLLQNKISFYYPKFLKHFQYYGSQEIVRNKQHGASDSRVPEIIVNNNIISCFTGKIQGIYYVEKYIKDNFNA